MQEIIKKLSEPLKPQDIYLYPKKIGKTGGGKHSGLFVVYKTSRSVIERLNEVLGCNWWDEYEHDHNGALFCRLSIKTPEGVVTRIGVGTAKSLEKEKSEYSDALKVAAVKFGIGLELYKMPTLFIKLEDTEVLPDGKINNFEVDFKKWEVKYKYEGGEIKDLEIFDSKGKKRWG